MRQIVDSDVSVINITDDENSTRVDSNEEGFAVEYEPISFSDEERLVAIHGYDQGIRKTWDSHYPKLYLRSQRRSFVRNLLKYVHRTYRKKVLGL